MAQQVSTHKFVREQIVQHDNFVRSQLEKWDYRTIKYEFLHEGIYWTEWQYPNIENLYREIAPVTPPLTLAAEIPEVEPLVNPRHKSFSLVPGLRRNVELWKGQVASGNLIMAQRGWFVDEENQLRDHNLDDYVNFEEVFGIPAEFAENYVTLNPEAWAVIVHAHYRFTYKARCLQTQSQQMVTQFENTLHGMTCQSAEWRTDQIGKIHRRHDKFCQKIRAYSRRVSCSILYFWCAGHKGVPEWDAQQGTWYWTDAPWIAQLYGLHSILYPLPPIVRL